MPNHSIQVEVFMLILLSSLSHLGNIRHVSSLSEFNVNCKEVERKSLLKFKAGLTDPSGRLTSWVGTDCCKWRGVVCNNRTGRVVKLKLRNPFPHGVDDDGTTYSLGGEISPSLLDLKYLKYLDLSSNAFQGIEIPKHFGAFDKLRYLNLSRASFGDTIPPDIGNITSLHYLDLSYNGFNSYIPHRLFKLSKLAYLDLSFNYLRCPIPDAFGNMTLLQVLRLSYNTFEGSEIPTSLANLCNLRILDLYRSNIHGEITRLINGLSRCNDSVLETLDLSWNQLHGPVPPSMASLTSLRHLNLSDNNFSGRIPTGSQFGKFNDPSIYGGNPQLCGPPLLIKCSDENAPADSSGDDDDFETLKLLITMGMGFALGFWGVCGTLVLKKSWRHAFFRFVDDMKDKLYVLVTVNWRRLLREH